MYKIRSLRDHYVIIATATSRPCPDPPSFQDRYEGAEGSYQSALDALEGRLDSTAAQRTASQARFGLGRLYWHWGGMWTRRLAAPIRKTVLLADIVFSPRLKPETAIC
jgi:hypothetical protein